MDKISSVNLSKNNIGDKGVELLMQALKDNKSLVCLNLSSNEISSAGFISIFETMSNNQSINYLNLSTLEGANRNRLSKKALKKFNQMLIKN
jgi:deoxyhypusine synthase